MKRVRCPRCGQYITFDENRCIAGQSLVFRCEACGKQFGIRISSAAEKAPSSTVDKIPSPDADNAPSNAEEEAEVLGSLVVIENVFHYKQVLPLHLGDNTIGRYQKGNPITTPIETDDPSIDLLHCVVNVGRDKQGRPRYLLRDANSNTGTFVDNTELAPREQRVITNGSLFTIGATSIILKTEE